MSKKIALILIIVISLVGCSSDDEETKITFEGKVEFSKPNDIENTSNFNSTNIKSLKTDEEKLENELIIKFNTANKDDVISENNLELKEKIGKNLYLYQGSNIDIEKIKANSKVEFAQYNYKLKYNLKKTSYNTASSNYHYDITGFNDLLKYNNEELNNLGPIRVGIIDTGIDLDHPYLKDNIKDGYDFVNDDNKADDKNGHGTHIAGIINATLNEDNQMKGLASNVELVPIKVMGQDGTTDGATLYKGLEYAKENNIDVLNLSIGGQTYYEENELYYENLTKGYDIIGVSASGNQGQEGINYPAGYQALISVGSINSNLSKSSFSNYGEKLDFVAPGSNIHSTAIDGGYKYSSGTSQATPVIASLIALLKGQNKDLSLTEIKKRLNHSSITLEDDKSTYQFPNFYRSFNDKGIANAKVFVGRLKNDGKIERLSKLHPIDKAGHFKFKTLLKEDNFRLYVWLDINSNSKIDKGDYIDKSALKQKSNFKFDLKIKEE